MHAWTADGWIASPDTRLGAGGHGEEDGRKAREDAPRRRDPLPELAHAGEPLRAIDMAAFALRRRCVCLASALGEEPKGACVLASYAYALPSPCRGDAGQPRGEAHARLASALGVLMGGCVLTQQQNFLI